MKTIEKPSETKEKSFNAVEFMRERRDRLSAMFSQMSTEEIIAYLRQSQMTSTIRPAM